MCVGFMVDKKTKVAGSNIAVDTFFNIFSATRKRILNFLKQKRSLSDKSFRFLVIVHCFLE